MEYIDKKNSIIWTEEMFTECERLWDYFELPDSDPFNRYTSKVKDILWNWSAVNNTTGKYNAIGWLVANGYTVETFTVEYAGIPTEQTLLLLLP
jgi:hypothetical protein